MCMSMAYGFDVAQMPRSTLVLPSGTMGSLGSRPTDTEVIRKRGHQFKVSSKDGRTLGYKPSFIATW